MTSSDPWDAETARGYDESCAAMFPPEVLGPSVDVLADLAGTGRALEFAVGTGRVAMPLTDRGVPVSGIELSQPMVEQLRRKVPASDLPVTIGDMATTRVPGIRRLPPGQAAVPFEVSAAHSGFDTYDVVSQQGTSHHFSREPDGSYRYSATNFRYIWPAECDLMARLAGLEFQDGWADWTRAPFTAESDWHISVWRKPDADRRPAAGSMGA
ncbi:MAG: class I SAM-dependent methyltransferase [Propionibacterium sp.]|nr:class I SAM-dependent methyltransferase [Propionibacterium sp.]